MEAIASFDTWIWHTFFEVAGSQNDLNVLGQSPVFNDVLKRHSPQIMYQINNTVYSGDVARMFDEDVLRSTMMICIILYNMIVDDEYDYDAPEMFALDLMNTSLTRIYERPLGANRELLGHEPLIRDSR
ncbi:unnamed protein product [Prunus armeniaca]